MIMLSIADRKMNAPPSPDEVTGGEPAKDSRTAPRLLASEVPSIEGIRLSPYRAEAALIDISESGLLAECGMRLQPGTEVTVIFSGSFTPTSVTGRVARTVIARIGSAGIRYHVGIAFGQPIAIPESAAAAERLRAEAAVPAAAAVAVVEPSQPEAQILSAPDAPAAVTPVESPEPPAAPRLVNQW